MRIFILLLLVIAASGCYTTLGTSGAQMQAPAAAEDPEDRVYAEVTSDTALVYADASALSNVVAYYLEGDEVLVSSGPAGFYEVVRRPNTLVGYALRTDLEALVPERRPVAHASVSRLDPHTATFYSLLISGGGQFYTGKYTKGGLILVTSIAAPLIGYNMTISSIDIDCSGTACQDETNYAPIYAGAAIGLGAWLYGVVTAADDAREQNHRDYAIGPVAKPTGSGLALRVSF